MTPQPNILVFMTDHQRGETLLPGHPCRTPNVDRIRGRAVTFSNAFCPAPHCCPSRATFFTGLYPSQHGVWNNVSVGNALSRGLYDGVRTFSEDLREAGYQLYFSGKWHVSQVESPAARGFTLLRDDGQDYHPFPNAPAPLTDWAAYRRGDLDGLDTPREPSAIVRPGYPHYTLYGIDEDPYGDLAAVRAAAAQLERMPAGAPFMLFAGPLGPHDPYKVPQRFLDLYPEGSLDVPENFDDDMADKPALYRRTAARYGQLTRAEHAECVRRYLAFCSYEDYLFGLLLDALEAGGRLEDTVIVYCSDHGDYAGAHGLWAKGLPCFEEAYRICAMVAGPGVVRPGRVEERFVSLADFAPTFLELAGAPAGRAMTGRSLMPLLRDQPVDGWRDTCYTQTNGNEIYGIQRAVWDADYHYVFNSFDFDELYDRRRDPGQMTNLLAGSDPVRGPYGPIVRRMCAKMWRFAQETGDPSVNPYIMTALAPFGPGILEEEQAHA